MNQTMTEKHWLWNDALKAVAHGMALFDGEVALDRRELSHAIHGIGALLLQQRGAASQKVAIWAERGHQQLCAIAAIAASGGVPVIVERCLDTEIEQLKDLGVSQLLTDRNAETIGDASGLSVLRLADAKPSRDFSFPKLEAMDAAATGLICIDETVKHFSVTALEAAFESLDACIEPVASDVFLVLRERPALAYLFDVLWALSRGITLAFSSHPLESALAEHLPNPDQFPMDFGLFYFGSHIEGSSIRDIYAQIRQTASFGDRHGFKSIWTPERHLNEFGGLYPNPSLLGAAIATITEQIQIRCGSIVAPLHHPVRIVEDWSVVDNLSGGRVGMAFACGWNCDDFVFQPQNYEHRHAVMFEQIRQARRMWAGEPLDFPNGMGKAVPCLPLPRPVQAELPVWVTVSGKRETFVNAAAHGANILTHMLYQDPSMLIDQIKAYRDALAENGFDPHSRTVTVMSHTYVNKDREQVRALVREPLKNYIKSSVHLIESMVKTATELNAEQKAALGRFKQLEDTLSPQQLDEMADIAFERFFNNAGMLGTPDSLEAMVRKLHDYGVDEIACLIDFGLDSEQILDGLSYLDQLRSRHDPRRIQRYRVTLCGIDADQVETFVATLPGGRLPASVRKILVASDAPKTLPLDDMVALAYRDANDGPCIQPHSSQQDKLMQISADIDEDF